MEPFEIAKWTPGVELLTREEFEGFVGSNCSAALFGPHRDSWSGFVVPVDGLHVIALNYGHPPTRQQATLTEELFHIRLGHKPCRLSQCPISGIMRREYTHEIEKEAYHSAAAALVPYLMLRELIKSGATIESIAEHFHVSVKLVQFRMNVTRVARLGRGRR